MEGSPAMEDPDRLAGQLIQRAWNRDGLPEIAGGLIALYVSGIFVIQLLFEKEWPVLRAIPVALVLLIPSGYLVPWAVKKIRARYLIERTGYVVMRPLSRKKRMWMVLISGIAGALALVAVAASARGYNIPSASQWILAGTGVLGGVLYPVCGRAWRFVCLGAVFAVTGILLGLYNVGYATGWAVLYGVTGALSLISGTVVLLHYLRQSREAGD
jgi:hypothetical protein